MLTFADLSDNVTDVKVNSRDFQRDFARMKSVAASGETIYVISGEQEFIFRAVEPRTWRGALKGKARIAGDLFSTDLPWESDS